MKIMYFSSASSSRQKLTYLLSALGVADGSYCLIQKMPCAPVPISLTRLRLTRTTTHVPATAAPDLCTRHPSPAHRTETPTPRPPPTRTACLPTAPWPLLTHCALASAHSLTAPQPLPARPGCCAPVDASPPAFASATARPSSGILDTKRDPTPMPRLHLGCCAPASAATP
jgi:hypothetical protein